MDFLLTIGPSGDHQTGNFVSGRDGLILGPTLCRPDNVRRTSGYGSKANRALQRTPLPLKALILTLFMPADYILCPRTTSLHQSKPSPLLKTLTPVGKKEIGSIETGTVGGLGIEPLGRLVAFGLNRALD